MNRYLAMGALLGALCFGGCDNSDKKVLIKDSQFGTLECRYYSYDNTFEVLGGPDNELLVLLKDYKYDIRGLMVSQPKLLTMRKALELTERCSEALGK